MMSLITAVLWWNEQTTCLLNAELLRNGPYRVPQKVSRKLLSISSPNIDRLRPSFFMFPSALKACCRPKADGLKFVSDKSMVLLSRTSNSLANIWPLLTCVFKTPFWLTFCFDYMSRLVSIITSLAYIIRYVFISHRFVYLIQAASR